MTAVFYVGDARNILEGLSEKSVQCVITSPPYYNLRDYDVEGQIGLEPTLDEYLNNLVEVFREVRRVLRDDGVAWCNMGDSYASAWPCSRRNVIGSGSLENGKREARPPRLPGGLKEKDLMMVPFRLALALQADGWYVRSTTIWAKPNPMPESTKDRPTTAHEYVFLLTKKPRYFYDAQAIAEPSVTGDRTTQPAGWDYGDGGHGSFHREGRRPPKQDGHGRRHAGFNDRYDKTVAENGGHPATRNKRTVWTIPPKPFPEAHFATFPPALIEPMVKAGTSEMGCCAECGAPWKRETERVSEQKQPHWSGEGRGNGVVAGGGHEGRTGQWSLVTTTTGWAPTCACDAGEPVPCTALDPFSGAGTVALVCEQLGRNSVNVDLKDEYVDMAINRLGKAGYTDVEIVGDSVLEQAA